MLFSMRIAVSKTLAQLKGIADPFRQEQLVPQFGRRKQKQGMFRLRCGHEPGPEQFDR
jgi:hypothetical protein